VTSLPLRVMLKFGRIRPVDRPIVIKLHAITGSERLRTVIDHWAEDQWELWDMLELMAGEGYNPKRLWRAIPGDREHLCQIVRPEQWRLYSISSAWTEAQDELHLTVGGLRYWTQDTGVSRAEGRQGTGSNFLAHLAAGGAPLAGAVSIKIVHPPRFSLPRDPDRPVVMIAAGTGIAPMRGLIDERTRCGANGPNWLFYGAQEWDDFYYQRELAPLVAAGCLTVRAAFSREDVSAQFDAERSQFVPVQGKAGRVDSLLLAPENSQQLWHMLQGIADGGAGAYFYVCGRTPFANSVLEALKAVIVRYVSPAAGETREAAAGRVLYRLIGEDRLMLEIFTTYAGAHFDHAKPQFDLSDVAQHNDDANGYWIVISGRVYDMNEFNHIHPGGAKIIQSYSGMDGTLAYQKVEHHLNPEVDAMLGMVELGTLRTPDFGAEWGIAVSGSGLRMVTLRDAYGAWIDLLHMLVEIENAVQNDFRVRDEPLTDIEVSGTIMLTAAKVNQLALAHERLVTGYLSHLLGGPVETLWAMIVGVGRRGDLDARWMRQRLAEAAGSDDARAVTEFAARLRASLKEEGASNDVDARYAAVCDTIETEDRAMLRLLKQALCAGAKLLETHQRDSVRLAGEQLIEILQSIPAVLEDYYRQFNARTA
jgi:sulfite reductase (NADPH) flavoprotein alpha-component